MRGPLALTLKDDKTNNKRIEKIPALSKIKCVIFNFARHKQPHTAHKNC